MLPRAGGPCGIGEQPDESRPETLIIRPWGLCAPQGQEIISQALDLIHSDEIRHTTWPLSTGEPVRARPSESSTGYGPAVRQITLSKGPKFYCLEYILQQPSISLPSHPPPPIQNKA